METSGKSSAHNTSGNIVFAISYPFTVFTEKKNKPQESTKARQVVTEEAYFSPSTNDVSSFACTITLGSRDLINNKNVSAVVLY